MGVKKQTSGVGYKYYLKRAGGAAVVLGGVSVLGGAPALRVAAGQPMISAGVVLGAVALNYLYSCSFGTAE